MVSHDIPPSELRLSLRRSIIASSCGMFWAAAVFGMPLPMLMESLGASGILIGLLTTVRQFAMLAQIPGAFITERLRTRKLFWAVMTIAHRLVWFLPAFLPIIYPKSPAFLPMLIVATVALSDTLANSASSAWFSWMTDLVPKKTSGQFWGLRHSWVTGTSLLAMALYGFVLDWFPSPGEPGGSFVGFTWVFSMAALFGVLDIIIHFRVSEPPVPPVHENSISLKRVLAPLKIVDFRQLTWSAGAWSFAVGLPGAFSAVYLKRTFDVTYSELALTAIAGTLGATLTGFIIGRLIDRIGARPLLVLSMALASTTGFAWFFLSPGRVDLPFLDGVSLPQPIVIISIGSFVAGICYSGVILCQLRLLTALSPGRGRTMAMAVHFSMVGILAALGPALGGLLMDFFTSHPISLMLPLGAKFEFFQILIILHIVIVVGVAIPLALKIQIQSGDMPVGMAARIILVNPLQAVRNLYNISFLAEPRSSREKVERVKTVGQSRSPLAMPDLILQLKDPSLEVQEEAIRAIGKIGGHAALYTLLELMKNPAADNHPVIARALGEIGDKKASTVLQNALNTSDRYTVIESARALGRIKDKTAIPLLVALFHMGLDDKITAAAAIALGELKHEEALPWFFELVQSTGNQALKQALAMAVSEVLGDTGGFYRVLVGENRSPGSELENLCIQLKKITRRILAQKSTEKPAIEMLETLSISFETADYSQAAKSLETLYSLLWEGIEARNLSTGKMHLSGSFLRALAQRSPTQMNDPNDILLAVYLLLQTCPVHPLSRNFR